jgi:hypothetical protein
MLNHKVSIVLPTGVLGSDAEFKAVCAVMCNQFGGCTSVVGLGYWMDADNVVVEDNVVEVYSYVSEADFVLVEGLMRYLAQNAAIALRQDCVLYTIDGTAYLRGQF